MVICIEKNKQSRRIDQYFAPYLIENYTITSEPAKRRLKRRRRWRRRRRRREEEEEEEEDGGGGGVW